VVHFHQKEYGMVMVSIILGWYEGSEDRRSPTTLLLRNSSPSHVFLMLHP